jgi:hypothetical protein
MSPKPFPFPINVGTDICSVPRIFSILTKRGKAEPFLRQILSVQERNQLTHEKVIEPTRLYFKAIDRAKGLRKKKRETAGNVDFPTIIWELSRRNTIKEDVPVAERRQENYLEIEGSETTSSKLDHESSASIELATHTIGKVHQEPQDGDHIELAAVPVDSGPVAETDSINKTVTDKEEAIAPETRSDLEDASGKVDIAQVEGNDAVTADNGQAQQQKDQEERPWSLNAAKQEITRTRDLIQRGARFLAGR